MIDPPFPFTGGKGVPNITPEVCRSARAILNWSMRDLQAASGVSLPTIVKIEEGSAVTLDTMVRVARALFEHGVMIDGQVARIWRAGGERVPVHELLRRELDYVTFRRREDGTYRVLFEVPSRLRPDGWNATTPLPIVGKRTGKLDNAEVTAIRRDAKMLIARLKHERLSQAFKSAAA